MTFASSGTIHTVEVQVKGETKGKGIIKLSKLAEWLCHFPDKYNSSECLLNRLLQEPSRFILMMMSGRCSDATSVYVRELSTDIQAHRSGTVKKTDVVAFIKELTLLTKPDTKDIPLEVKRKAHVSNLITTLTEPTLRKALHRLLLVERIGEGDVKVSCEEMLRKTYKLVPDLIAPTTLQLMELISSAKEAQTDAIPIARDLLESLQPHDPLRFHGYINRGDEETLKEILTRQKTLLLAGRPRTGKTSTSRWLAADLMDLGFSVKPTSDLETAQRFLLDPVDTPRLVLLDDPFGGAHPADDALRNLLHLQQLIPLLGVNRRLIVAQAQDRLLEVTRKEKLSEITTAGLTWTELPDLGADFSCKLWTQLAQNYQVSDGLTKKVMDALRVGTLSLEPGCILHLAATHIQLNGVAELNEIERLAREDSHSLGRALEHEGFKPVLSALAVTTTPDLPVGTTELAFVMGNGGPDKPGLSNVTATWTILNVTATCTTLGASESVARKELQYVPFPNLNQAYQETLEKLQLRRLVEHSVTNLIWFTHPFYRACAESLLDTVTQQSEVTALTLLNRSLFSLAPNTSLAAASNLGWMHERLAANSGKEKVISTAITGLKSVFPATRDSCFAFLARKFHKLPESIRANVSTWVSDVTFFDLSDMEWVNGQARIPMGNSAGVLERQPVNKTPTEQEVHAALEFLNSSSAGALSPAEAAKVLAFYEESTEKMTVQSVSRLLSYDVALIRASAVRTWLSVPRTNDDLVLARIFGEQHPAVALAALKAVVQSWWECTLERKIRLKDGIQQMSQSFAAAAALIEPLVLFGRTEHTGNQTPWKLFEAVMPQVMEVLPLEATIHEARFYDVIQKSSKHISIATLLKIVDLWIELVKRQSTTRIPSNDFLGVTSVLIQGTKDHKNLRGQRIENLLQVHGTGAQIVVIADLVDGWEELTDAERSTLIAEVCKIRRDSHWIKAAALTRNQVPPELEKSILPEALSLGKPPSELILNMDDNLLCAAASIYMGNPQPLYYIGAHHSGGKVWEAVIEEIARTPKHLLFHLAWQHITAAGDGVRVAQFVQALGTENSHKVFEILLQQKLDTSGNFMPEAWETLFQLAPNDASRSSWIAKMAQTAPSTLDSLSKAVGWVPKIHLEEFLHHFKNDVTLLRLLSVTSKIFQEEETEIFDEKEIQGTWREDLAVILNVFIEKIPPLHHDTYWTAKNFVQNFRIGNAQLLTQLENGRLKTLNLRETSSYTENSELRDWVW